MGSKRGPPNDVGQGSHSDSERPTNKMPERGKSITLPVPEQGVNRDDYIEALEAGGIDKSGIKCIQYCGDKLVITLNEKEQKQALLAAGVLQVAGKVLVTQDTDHPLTYVTVYDAPYEVPDEALKKQLQRFGKVKSIRRRMHRDTGIETGVRTIRMTIGRHIPSYIRIGHLPVRIKYEDQPQTCKKCDSEGHIARDCFITRCYNCDQTGHMAFQCEEEERCCICNSSEHVAEVCPYNWELQPYETMDEEDKRVEQPAQDNTQQQQQQASPFHGVSPLQVVAQQKKQEQQSTQHQVQQNTSKADTNSSGSFLSQLVRTLPQPQPQIRTSKGSGRQPAPINLTQTAAPIRKKTNPAPLPTTNISLAEDLARTAKKNTDNDTNENMEEETKSVASKRTHISSSTQSSGNEDEDTLESTRSTPDNSPKKINPKKVNTSQKKSTTKNKRQPRKKKTKQTMFEKNSK